MQTLMDSMQSKLLRETEVLQGKLATTRQALQRQTAKNKYLKKKVVSDKTSVLIPNILIIYLLFI